MLETLLITTAETPQTHRETTPTTRTTNTLTERTVTSVLPIRTLEKTVGCSTCDVCKRRIQKGYQRAVCINCVKERHLQCTALSHSEREAIRYGDHGWAWYGTCMGPSIVQMSNIDPVQNEVKDAGIKTRNDNEDVAPKHGGHPVPNAPGK